MGTEAHSHHFCASNPAILWTLPLLLRTGCYARDGAHGPGSADLPGGVASAGITYALVAC